MKEKKPPSCAWILFVILASVVWMVVVSLIVGETWYEWAWADFVAAAHKCPLEGDGGPCSDQLMQLLEQRRAQAFIWAIPIAAGLLVLIWLFPIMIRLSRTAARKFLRRN